MEPRVVPGQQQLELDLDLAADNVDVEDVEDRLPGSCPGWQVSEEQRTICNWRV